MLSQCDVHVNWSSMYTVCCHSVMCQMMFNYSYTRLIDGQAAHA